MDGNGATTTTTQTNRSAEKKAGPSESSRTASTNEACRSAEKRRPPSWRYISFGESLQKCGFVVFVVVDWFSCCPFFSCTCCFVVTLELPKWAKRVGPFMVLASRLLDVEDVCI